MNQIITVNQTDDTKAVLKLWEKKNKEWHVHYHTMAYIGKNGLGKEKEGDAKTPAGVYHLMQGFGIKENPGTKLPYTQLHEYHYWGNDDETLYYNRMVDARDYAEKIKGEHLLTYGKAYHYAIWINYNEECIKGEGSCIFLHCMGEEAYTQGCIAISEDAIIYILRRIKQGIMICIG